MESYKELLVWQKSFKLVENVYINLRTMPSNESFGLTAQVKRAVVSVPSNIAEDWGRNSQKSFAQFLKIARASLCELETQLLLINKLKLTHIEETIFEQITAISKMINALLKKVESTIKNH